MITTTTDGVIAIDTDTGTTATGNTAEEAVRNLHLKLEELK